MTKPTFSIKDILQSKVGGINGHLVNNLIPLNSGELKKSKYKNERVEVNGIWFDSKREAGRYRSLLILVDCNLISNLRLQVEYELNAGGKFSYKYIADFVYLDDKRNEIVEDAKGAKTVVYKKKKKLMKQLFDIEIKET